MHFYRDEKNRVYIQSYDSVLRRNVRRPRTETKKYDEMRDDQIEALLEKQRHLSPAAMWYLHDPIRQKFDLWIDHLAEEEKLDKQTIRQHQTYIERYVFEYFASVVKLKDPTDWPKFSARFYTWMKTEGYKEVVKDTQGKPKLTVDGKIKTKRVPATASIIRAAQVSYRKFYRWLGEEGHVPPIELTLRSPPMDEKVTKLPRAVLPEEVVAWAKTCPVEHVKFCGLVGYFLSLRPQESFAAMEKDFRVGSKVSDLECIKAMKLIGQYDKFAFYVHQQQQNSGEIKLKPKGYSKEWVACFNKEAAELIVDLVNNWKPTEIVERSNRKSRALASPVKIKKVKEPTLARWNNRKLYEDWKIHGLPGIDLKDLRRASLYWLGHYTTIQPLQLMKHARHKDMETTMLYCRRFGETTAPRTGRLNLED